MSLSQYSIKNQQRSVRSRNGEKVTGMAGGRGAMRGFILGRKRILTGISANPRAHVVY